MYKPKNIISDKGYVWESELYCAGYNNLPEEDRFLIYNENGTVTCSALNFTTASIVFKNELIRLE